jgi:hypothetical protein
MSTNTTDITYPHTLQMSNGDTITIYSPFYRIRETFVNGMTIKISIRTNINGEIISESPLSYGGNSNQYHYSKNEHS